jgi:hypothetical protein
MKCRLECGQTFKYKSSNKSGSVYVYERVDVLHV